MNVWVLIYRLAWSAITIVAIIGIAIVFKKPVNRFHELQVREQRLKDENRLKQEMLDHLKAKQERLIKDPRFVEKIAREELGYAKPGETVFKFVDDEPTNARAAR